MMTYHTAPVYWLWSSWGRHTSLPLFCFIDVSKVRLKSAFNWMETHLLLTLYNSRWRTEIVCHHLILIYKYSDYYCCSKSYETHFMSERSLHTDEEGQVCSASSSFVSPSTLYIFSLLKQHIIGVFQNTCLNSNEYWSILICKQSFFRINARK